MPAIVLRRLFALTLVFAVLSSSSPLAPRPAAAQGPTIWCVSPSGAPTQSPCFNRIAYNRIEQAVRNAAIGDEIRLARGVYIGGDRGVITLRDTFLSFVGGYADDNWATPSDANQTILDAQGVRRGVAINNGSGLFANLTIRNGVANGREIDSSGGGMFIFASAADPLPLYLINVTFEQNTALGAGGAVYALANLLARDVRLVGNRSELGAGGIQALEADIDGLVAAGNETRGGAGALAVSTCICTNLDLRNNTAFGGAGALALYGESLIADSVMIGNRARYNGGAVVYSGGSPAALETLIVRDSIFHDNASVRDLDPNPDPDAIVLDSSFGGAIYTNGPITIERSRFTANRADAGGAVFHGYGSGPREPVLIRESLFVENEALRSAGGAIGLHGTGTIVQSEFRANAAEENGGAIAHPYGTNSGVVGGPMLLEDVILHENSSRTGEGGAMALGDTYRLVRVRITNNRAATNGGGVSVAARRNNYGFPMEIERSTIADNRAIGGSGGGLYLPEASIVMTGTALLRNRAGADGGAMAHLVGREIRITGSLLADNHAEGQGHAFYAQGAYRFDLLNVTVASATQRTGAALVIDKEEPITAELRNTLVTSHTIGLHLPRNSELTGDYAAFFAVPTELRIGTDAGDAALPTLIRADPRFVNPRNSDYRLANGSPLINQGDPARDYAGQTDVFGGRVPFGGRADIGAHEHVPINAQVFLPLVRRGSPFLEP
jgi:predicted outer membrane repeat protein